MVESRLVCGRNIRTIETDVMQPSTQASNAWRVLFLLFLANLFNFFDRTIPAIIAEPIRLEWSLNDFQLGLIGTAFTIVYAIAGLPLGRMADLGSRRKIMGWGLTAWSGLTAINGLAWNFWSFLLIRMGIGIGEASYAPAANSLIGDLFPAHKRARAMGIVKVSQEPVQQPIRKVLSIRTFWWLVMAGLAFIFATYACNAFMVPLLMRYHGVSLVNASVATGVIVGLTGLIGLTLGGWVADRIHQRFARGRLMFAAASMLTATLATGYALLAGRIAVGLFAAVSSIGWLFSYNFYTCVYTAIQDVVEPRLRATAMALFFAGLYLLGGGMGTVVVGLLSDHFAEAAMLAAGAGEMAEAFRAEGLHGAMYLIPASLLLTMVFLFQASRTFCADAKRMTAGMTAGAPGTEAVPA